MPFNYSVFLWTPEFPLYYFFLAGPQPLSPCAWPPSGFFSLITPCSLPPLCSTLCTVAGINFLKHHHTPSFIFLKHLPWLFDTTFEVLWLNFMVHYHLKPPHFLIQFNFPWFLKSVSGDHAQPYVFCLCSFVVVHALSHVLLSVTPRAAACHASLFFTILQSLLTSLPAAFCVFCSFCSHSSSSSLPQVKPIL